MEFTEVKEQSSRFDLPGLTLPLNWKPDQEGKDGKPKLFPNAIDPDHVEDEYAGSRAKTMRELTMMRIMNAITEKPEWERKVFDNEITFKWKEEISPSEADVSPKMIKWIFDELQYKAERLKETGMVLLFTPGVVRSDSAISKELQNDLRMAVMPLEQIPENEKDYHPGSECTVVDLVHPSLFPVIYGRTQCLHDELITIDNCWAWSGETKVLADPQVLKTSCYYFGDGNNIKDLNFMSKRFQWLPCDVEFSEDGKPRIVSYINNLHPEKHSALYSIIERIIDNAIPLWDESLLEAQWEPPLRIPLKWVKYVNEDEAWPKDRMSDEELQEWDAARPVHQPEPEGGFITRELRYEPSRWDYIPRGPRWDHHMDLRETFRKSGLQVIVKLANIELTPDNPKYNGGTWHVEGQLNERICATAIYYYSNENITHSSLSFRQHTNACSFAGNYEQNHWGFLQSVYGFGPETGGTWDGPVTQDLGDVSCTEGRLLTFPNILQHRVAPFELADKTKPGHRKILALFLVDPHMRIISTANVPPQRADWWDEKFNLTQFLGEKRLPLELQQMVLEDCDLPVTMDQAKEYRLKLMEERKAQDNDKGKLFETGNFGLCEH